MSIRDNIIFGREKELSENYNDINELIGKACKKACIYDFINNLKEGYDYIVGVGGNNISGGQKQCIAIARSILTNPKLLIFDEATINLNKKNKKKVTIAIKKVIINYKITTIFVTHNLNLIKNMIQFLI